MKFSFWAKKMEPSLFDTDANCTEVVFSERYTCPCLRKDRCRFKTTLSTPVLEATTDTEIVERSDTATVGKASIEYKWKSLSPAEQALFQEAINAEWKQWIDKGVVTIVSFRVALQLDRSRILPTRFVLTNKDKTGDTIIAKARLVVGGHRDPDLSHLRTDAPTADGIAISIILMLAASFKWELQSGDITTAFLSGVEDHRDIYIKPPKEGLPGIREGQVLRLNKGAYGLANAPRLWWRRIRSILESVGMTELKLLPCTFAKWHRDKNGNKIKLSGILALHVDDLLITGDSHFEHTINQLKQMVSFGKWFNKEFDYTGRHIKQLDDFSVEISQPAYAAKIPRVPINKEQIAKEEMATTEQTKGDLRKTAGSG